VFTVFFGKFLGVEKHVAEVAGPGGKVGYGIFVFSGLLAWNFAASTVGGAAGVTAGNAGLITRVYFPRILLPLSVLGATFLDFAIAAAVLAALLAWQGVVPGLAVLSLPAVLAGIAACAIGVGSMLSALNVRYRDFGYVLPFLIQTWLFMTPVIYPTQVVPERFRWIVALNPMTGLVDAFRACLLGMPLEAGSFYVSCTVALLCLLAGLFYFRQVEDHFADII
jgi:lipopolysaccharide transport system permease protein